MSITVMTRELPPPKVNKKELLRYAGGSKNDVTLTLMERVIEEYSSVFCYRVAYTVLDIKTADSITDFGLFTVRSKSLATALSGCGSAYLLAATVGGALDRAVRSLSITSPAASHMLDSFGSERVESLLDCFTEALESETGEPLTPRVSAGYGDIPLSAQGYFFKLLSPEGKIGLYLNDSLLMTPMKSVTAFIGIKKRGNNGKI